MSTSRQGTTPQNLALARNRRRYDLDVKITFSVKASAVRGRQQATLDELLRMIRAGEIRVVSVAALDRIDRRGPLMREWVTAVVHAGGRVVSGRSDEEWVADVSDMNAWSARLSEASVRAEREAEIMAERIRDTHRMIDESGATRVRAKLGWKIEGPKYSKKHVEVPETMGAVLAALTKVAETGRAQDGARVLAEHGYPRTPDTIRNIANDEAYVGALGVIALRARQALRSHADAGPRRKDTGSDSYAGRIYCRHGSTLYSHLGPLRKDRTRELYYSASASRDTCAAPCGSYRRAEVDAAVDALLADETSPEYTVAGATGALANGAEEDVAQTGWLIGERLKAMSRQERRRWLERQGEMGLFRVTIVKDGPGAASVRAVGVARTPWPARESA